MLAPKIAKVAGLAAGFARTVAPGITAVPGAVGRLAALVPGILPVPPAPPPVIVPPPIVEPPPPIVEPPPIATLPAIPANSGGPMPLTALAQAVLPQVPGIITALAGRPAPPAPPALPPPLPVPVPRPALPAIAAGRAIVGRRFFERFPNLATSIQQLRDRGIHVKRSQLWNLMRRFGPEVLITGGLLTAAATSELMAAGPGRRRMNVANTRALRRSMRRIEGFHKLCMKADILRRRAPARRAKCT